MKKISRPACLFLIAAATLFVFFCVYLKVSPDRLTGAAFCHQLPARSPAFGFPFCYRCSGLFFGIFFGLLTSCFTGRSDKLCSRPLLAACAVSIILFLLDILNSSKFPIIHVYPEKVSYRFLSAYPLGYCTAQLIASIFKYLLEEKKSDSKIHIIPGILIFSVTAGLSFLLIFCENYSISLLSRIVLSFTALSFLALLYAILQKCYSLWRSKTIADPDLLLYGLSCSLLQISLIGFLHLRFLPFEQFI
ncbi:MAG: DUF2085 domain-containing protein [Flexilinea sp.]|nr:DUF2085 domain-containing protein [Flexilinea sp.]